MNTNELTTLLEGTLLTTAPAKEVKSVYCCDLLSWVMAKTKPGSALITVQTHLNVIAVGALLDVAAIIVPEGIEMAEESVSKALEEGIPVISSALSAYEICGRLYQKGIAGTI